MLNLLGRFFCISPFRRAVSHFRQFTTSKWILLKYLKKVENAFYKILEIFFTVQN